MHFVSSLPYTSSRRHSFVGRRRVVKLPSDEAALPPRTGIKVTWSGPALRVSTDTFMWNATLWIAAELAGYRAAHGHAPCHITVEHDGEMVISIEAR